MKKESFCVGVILLLIIIIVVQFSWRRKKVTLETLASRMVCLSAKELADDLDALINESTKVPGLYMVATSAKDARDFLLRPGLTHASLVVFYQTMASSPVYSLKNDSGIAGLDKVRRGIARLGAALSLE